MVPRTKKVPLESVSSKISSNSFVDRSTRDSSLCHVLGGKHTSKLAAWKYSSTSTVSEEIGFEVCDNTLLPSHKTSHVGIVSSTGKRLMLPITLRRLAPAGGFPNPRDVHPERQDLIEQTERLLKQLFDASALSLCGSGKSALEKILTYLKSIHVERLFVAGYSCPDIVASAVRAGLQVIPVDVNSTTLEPLWQNELIDPERDSVILSNLYGLVDSCSLLNGIRWVDDACQAALSFDEERRVGSRALGVLSFGRGKAICGIGGGATLGLSERDDVGDRNFYDRLKLKTLYLFERPSLYWLPAAVPFLGVGETVYDREYPEDLLSLDRLAAAEAILSKLSVREDDVRVMSSKWDVAFKDIDIVLPNKERERKGSKTSPGLIRFPILFPTEEFRDKAYGKLINLGASKSYPAPLTDLCKGERQLILRTLPGAREVSRRILTLPTHRYVEERDVEETADIIRKILC